MLDEKNIGNDSSSLSNGNHFPSIVVSNVPRKYAILAGYKIVMNQRSVCTRFINPWNSGFALVSRDL